MAEIINFPTPEPPREDPPEPTMAEIAGEHYGTP